MHSHGNDNAELSAKMPKTEDCIAVASAFAQLGDGTRLKILWLLCHSEQCVTNIAHLTGMSGPAVAHHLRLLKSANLIVSRREGKEMRYRLGESNICHELHRAIDALFRASFPDCKFD
ncbi:MAG: winged helix-turn-helix transcriptional regulator [Clostridia bacterium]|nr:winged helix-turn-helix transcriptional regulator [Clostridia bacterium]